METLQIRLPKNVISKIDQLLSGGFYQNRSQIIRQAVQKFIQETSYNGSMPYIVGPYSKDIDKKLFDQPLNAYEVPKEKRDEIQKIIQDIEFVGI